MVNPNLEAESSKTKCSVPCFFRPSARKRLCGVLVLAPPFNYRPLVQVSSPQGVGLANAGQAGLCPCSQWSGVGKLQTARQVTDSLPIVPGRHGQLLACVLRSSVKRADSRAWLV